MSSLGISDKSMVLGSRFWVLGSLVAGFAAGATQLAAERQAKPVAAATVAFDGGRAYEHMRQLVSFGPRPAGSPAIERTRGYISDQLKALGITVSLQPFDAKTPIGTIHMVNVIG